jgi:hypothetical protein
VFAKIPGVTVIKNLGNVISLRLYYLWDVFLG